VVKTAESMSIEVIRMLMLASQQPKIGTVTVRVHEAVAAYLNNKKRREVARLEDLAQMTVQILGSEAVYPEHLTLECKDVEGREIVLPV
jgi:ribonuclease E